jgi:hypothetical protein
MGVQFKKSGIGSSTAVAGMGLAVYFGLAGLWRTRYPASNHAWWWPTWWLVVPVLVVVLALVPLVLPLIPERRDAEVGSSVSAESSRRGGAGDRMRRKTLTTQPLISLLIGFVTLVALLVGTYSVGYQQGRNNNQGAVPKLLNAFTITCPADGATVPGDVKVLGKGSTSITENRIWLAYHQKGALNWYLGAPIDVRADGTWSQDVATGSPAGVTLRIALMGANQDVNSMLEDDLRNPTQYSANGIPMPKETVPGRGITVTTGGSTSC